MAGRPDNTGMWALTATVKERRPSSKTFGLGLILTVGGVFLVVGILDLRETQRALAEGELARGKSSTPPIRLVPPRSRVGRLAGYSSSRMPS